MASKEQIERSHDAATLWTARWETANKYYKEWESRHKCPQLAEYYEGKQYDESDFPEGMDPLVYNLFYAAVESRLPMMSFQKPIANLKPKPGKMDYDPEAATAQARLRQDMINTYLQDPDKKFGDVCQQAVLDAQFRFGVVEVGYSAEWIENPFATKPILKTDNSSEFEPETPAKNLEKTQPELLPEDERIYVKHIHPKNFRVGGNDKWNTQQCSWVGYSEFFRLEDLLAIPKIARILELEDQAGAYRSSDFVPGDSTTNQFGGEALIECLTVFDLRRRVRLFISKTHGLLLHTVPFARLPIFPLRFSMPAVDPGWFPVPPARSWKSPQDEHNSALNARKAYRHRALPKWVVADSAFPDEEELNKLTSPEPFTVSRVQSIELGAAIAPVPFPSLNAEFANTLVSSREDFNFAAGTSVDVTASADRETATKSKIVATRAGIRESRTLGIVRDWMCDIIREIALLQAERLTQEAWIKRALDTEPTLGEVKDLQYAWAKIDPTAQLNSDLDFEVTIDLSSLSPVAREETKNKFLEFLAIINNYPQFAFSPKLLRYLADLLDVRMEMVLRELQELALVAQLGMQAQAQNAMAQRTVAQATPSDGERITNQLENQVGLPE